jgi:hypothetical protein
MKSPNFTRLSPCDDLGHISHLVIRKLMAQFRSKQKLHVLAQMTEEGKICNLGHFIEMNCIGTFSHSHILPFCVILYFPKDFLLFRQSKLAIKIHKIIGLFLPQKMAFLV